MDEFTPNISFDRMNELADYGKSLQPLRQVFGKYIFEKSLIHFPSERGTGKTFFMMQLCLCVANEIKTYCNESIELHGNTLYINCELSRDLMARRLAKLYENPPVHLAGKNFESYMYTTRHSFAKDRTLIVEMINKLEPVLVVLDNWKTAYQDIDNNKNKDATKAVLDLLNLKDNYGFALVVTDHTRKGSKLLLSDSDLQSGSGAKSDLADQDFFLRKSSQDPSFRILKRSKSRICEDSTHAKLLRLNFDTLWFEVQEEEVDEVDHINAETISGKDEAYDLAKVMKENGATMEQIKAATGIPLSTLYRKLK